MKELIQNFHAQVPWLNTQILALIGSFLCTLVLGFIIIPLLRKKKVGQVVRDDGPQSHLKKAGTPTMGGIIILITVLVLSIIASLQFKKILPAALVTLGYGLIGFIDDFKKLVLKNPKGLSPKLKMLGLILVSGCFIGYLMYTNFGTDINIPIVKLPTEPVVLQIWFYVLFMLFVMVGTTNSLNLTDGLDGLAAGITAIIMIFFVFVSMAWGNKDYSVFSSIVAGSTIGFLFFNIYPARVFMGDTGSLALGGAICSIAILLKVPLILVVVAFICVVEAISVILQVSYFKITKGKRLFKMAPIHHHLELCGMKETVIVPMFWIITIIMCFIGFKII